MKATVTTIIIATVMLMASSNCCMIIETSADPKTRREISEFNIFLSNDVSSHDEVSVSHLIVVKLMDF